MPNDLHVSTTDAPGQYNKNHAPFDLPQGMGNGGVATKFFDTTVKATVGRSTVSGSGIPASNLTSPVYPASPSRPAAKASPPKNNK